MLRVEFWGTRISRFNEFLRRDGFISLVANGRAGTITTPPFISNGRRLFANVKTESHGQLCAEVLNAAGNVIATSEPLHGDQPRGLGGR